MLKLLYICRFGIAMTEEKDRRKRLAMQ